MPLVEDVKNKTPNSESLGSYSGFQEIVSSGKREGWKGEEEHSIVRR